MNILLLAKAYPPSPVYAESRHASVLASALMARGHAVRVLTTDLGLTDGGATDDSSSVERTGDYWPFYHYEPDSDDVLDSVGLLGCALEGVCLQDGTDLILAYGWARALAAFTLRQQTGAPTMVYLHGTTRGRRGAQLDASSTYWAEMEAWAAAEADAVICPSESVRREVVEYCGVGQEKTHVLTPAWDPERLHPGDTVLDDLRSLLGRQHGLLVVFAGRLVSDNGPDALVRGLPAILERGHQVGVVFAGDGEAAAEVMALAEESGVARLCLFAGHVSDQVLASLYACADVLAVPGEYCPSGASALEAMALSTPVVGSDVGALHSLLKDGRNGLKILPRDPDALAGALLWLSDSRERIVRMGREAKRTATKASSRHRSADVVAELGRQLSLESRS